MRARVILAGCALAIAAGGRARADEVFPLALPPMFYVDDAATVGASITDTKRAISAQWDAAQRWLFELGGGGVVDDTMMTYSLQVHAAFGHRFRLYAHPVMGAGHVKVALDARVVAGALFTQPGKDDSYAARVAAEEGLGVWGVTPKGVHAGLRVGMDEPFTKGSAEIVVSALVGIPYGEPDPHAAQTEAAAVDKMLTSDPATWPEGAFTHTVPSDTTIVSLGVVYAQPLDSTFESRLVLVLGVLYP